MNKKYKLTPRENWYIILAFASIPMVRLLMERTLSMSFYVQIMVYCLASLAIILSRSEVRAEIKDDVLYFYAGTGLSDPNQIQLSQITGTQRLSRRLLAVQYDGRTLTIEGYKKLLDQLQKDLNAMQ